MKTFTSDSPTGTPQLPPSINKSTWVQTFQGILKPREFLEASREIHGDIFLGKSIGYPEFAIISDPQAIEQIFTTDPHNFEVASSNAILNPLLGENSVILLDGSRHQRQRKLLMPPFHGERMRAYGETICEVTELVMQQWQNQQPFLMRSATQEITLRIILRSVFGIDKGTRFEELRQKLSQLLDSFNSAWGFSLLFLKTLQQDWGAWSPWGRFLRRKQEIDELLLAEIRSRRNSELGEDILSLMMAAKDENGAPMSDEELRDELMTLLFAGHETTASALAWAFYWLHRQPEVKEKLLTELNQLDPNCDPSLVTKLPYLSAVCSETLRLYPVVFFTFWRKLKVPMEIKNYQFDVGTILAPCVYLLHHHPDLYPQSKQFRPERFLERQFSPYEYIPFGGSNRRCIGYAFALFEMKLVLATVLKQVNLSLCDKRPITPMRRGVAFTPARGVEMVVTK